MHGKTIKAGDKVAMWYASGNRDPRHFSDRADELWIERPMVRSHMAFGYGIHRCVGNRLAELQLRRNDVPIAPDHQRLDDDLDRSQVVPRECRVNRRHSSIGNEVVRSHQGDQRLEITCRIAHRRCRDEEDACRYGATRQG